MIMKKIKWEWYMYKFKILLKYIFSEELEVKDLIEEKYN